MRLRFGEGGGDHLRVAWVTDGGGGTSEVGEGDLLEAVLATAWPAADDFKSSAAGEVERLEVRRGDLEESRWTSADGGKLLEAGEGDRLAFPCVDGILIDEIKEFSKFAIGEGERLEELRVFCDFVL